MSLLNWCIVFINDYDRRHFMMLMKQGHVNGFYDEVVLFMRNFFSGGLKDNRHLSFGFMTGILRVAKESIFSGLNNLKLNSVLDERYGQYFGFTPEEVRMMARYYGVPEKYGEICDWYDGYRFGGYEIFNPWSVISYFNNGCKPKAFWQFTGSIDITKDRFSLHHFIKLFINILWCIFQNIFNNIITSGKLPESFIK